MNTRVRRVDSKKELHNKIEDFQIQGYDLVEESDKHAKLQDKKYGTFGMHVLWFFIAGWCTFLLANIAYLIYAYSQNSKEIIIKVSNDE